MEIATDIDVVPLATRDSFPRRGGDATRRCSPCRECVSILLHAEPPLRVTICQRLTQPNLTPAEYNEARLSLFDHCRNALVLPSPYWIEGVTSGVYLSKGGEAIIYKGEYLGCEVIRRQSLHPQMDKGWNTDDGRPILEVMIIS